MADLSVLCKAGGGDVARLEQTWEVSCQAFDLAKRRVFSQLC